MRFSPLLMLLLTVVACGDGGGSTGEPPPEAPIPRYVLPPPDPAEGQDAALCGTHFPQLDPTRQDPFAALRSSEPSGDLVPPFPACRDAQAALVAGRRPCSEVAGRRTLLVTPRGDADPRWRSGAYAARFATIQAAIDAASHCDTIVVRPGVYRESLRIEGKDVRIESDVWDEAGATADGDERVDGHEAVRIDLARYHETGERVAVEARETVLRPLRRALRTVLEGGGFAAGPTLGGIIPGAVGHPEDPDYGCGSRRPLVEFLPGATRDTVLDGFSVRLLPEQDPALPGHGRTIEIRGSAPILRHNVVYQNGAGAIRVSAGWREVETAVLPCAHDPALARPVVSTDDFRSANVDRRAAPLVYDNILQQNAGAGIENDHYACTVAFGNEIFWNAVPNAAASSPGPGIGTQHGSKVLLERNVVHDNAWAGIGVTQGALEPAGDCARDPVACYHADERTQAVIRQNVVYDNGEDEAPEFQVGGIGVDGAGLPDDPVLVVGNVSYGSRRSGIGVRNELAGVGLGFLDDATYAVVAHNTVFSNDLAGIGCRGSVKGPANCTMVGNEAYWNRLAGIGVRDGARGAVINNVTVCNAVGIASPAGGGFDGLPLLNNIAYANVGPGIIDPDGGHDFNIVSGNNGQPVTCDEPGCANVQYGGVGPAAHDILTDPRFVDAPGHDFSLMAGSPAIDSGTDVSRYDPGWIVEGAAIDRGAHEYGAP